MKRILFKIFNLLMAVTVLVTSMGFGLVEHSCHMRGKKLRMVTVQEPACHGCPKSVVSTTEGQPVIQKEDCCKDEKRYENVDFTSSLSQLIAKFLKTVTEAVAVTITAMIAWIIDWVFSREASVAITVADSPPPAYGRTLLALVQSFLI